MAAESFYFSKKCTIHLNFGKKNKLIGGRGRLKWGKKVKSVKLSSKSFFFFLF